VITPELSYAALPSALPTDYRGKSIADAERPETTLADPKSTEATKLGRGSSVCPKFLLASAYVWFTLIVFITLATLFGAWLVGDLSTVLSLVSPWGLTGWLILVAAVMPGLALIVWSLAVRRRLYLLAKVTKPPESQ
jgi:hypothetical protein